MQTNPEPMGIKTESIVRDSGRVGWTCPVCGRAYSPDVMLCPRCSDAADQERVADPGEDVRLVEKEEL